MLDPILTEIIQNRLQEIGLQAGYALINTAASPAVVHSKDLGFNISDHLGRCIVYSMWMPRHGTTLSYMLKSCWSKFKDRIYPGDMFITNDPHSGALHTQDIAIISPVHYKDQLIAWTACATHHLDIGAMTPGRASQATEYLQEGIVIPPLKIMENFELKQEIFDLFLENVRVPHYQGLDLKGQIASNNIARDKILELASRYGVETLKESYEEIIDFSEEKTRERIKMLPEGVYEAEDYISYDKFYKVKCALTVKDGSITFDFAGTDPQAPNFINSALPCTVANVHNIVVCLLTPDIPINEGCLKTISVVAPERSIMNCKPPAPCSGSSVISGWTAMSLAVRTLSLALAKSKESWRVNASWPTSHSEQQMTGKNRRGRPFFNSSLVGAIMGGGARANKDGLNFASAPGSTTTSRLNAEHAESICPILILFSRTRPDSGGAGKFRGGVSGEAAFKLHGADKAEMFIFWVGKGLAADGIFGGSPGATSLVALKRNTNIQDLLPERLPLWNEIIGDEHVLYGNNPGFILNKKDVILLSSAGAGGYGNPLERDPSFVLRDVTEGYVSLEKAADDYGVVIESESSKVDQERTDRLRSDMCQQIRKNKSQASQLDSLANVIVYSEDNKK